jgi:hypothetical protein
VAAVNTKRCPRPEKRAYPTEEAALRHRNRLRFGADGSPDLAAYRCSCGMWHVGHSRERLNRRIGAALRHGHRLPGQRRRAW